MTKKVKTDSDGDKYTVECIYKFVYIPYDLIQEDIEDIWPITISQ